MIGCGSALAITTCRHNEKIMNVYRTQWLSDTNSYDTVVLHPVTDFDPQYDFTLNHEITVYDAEQIKDLVDYLRTDNPPSTKGLGHWSPCGLIFKLDFLSNGEIQHSFECNCGKKKGYMQFIYIIDEDTQSQRFVSKEAYEIINAILEIDEINSNQGMDPTESGS